MLMRQNYPSDTNRQIAILSDQALNLTAKATENKYWYLVPKGADSYREQFLGVFSPHTQFVT